MRNAMQHQRMQQGPAAAASMAAADGLSVTARAPLCASGQFHTVESNTIAMRDTVQHQRMQKWPAAAAS